MFGYFQTFKTFPGNLKDCQRKSIKTPIKWDNVFVSTIIFIYGRIRAKFKGNCLLQDSIPFIHRNIVNFYNIYELDLFLIFNLFYVDNKNRIQFSVSIYIYSYT